MRTTRLAVLLVALVGGALEAQSSGAVRDSLGRGPIAGAVVMVLDSSRTVVGRGITDGQGRYRVSSGADARYLRVVRIGFQPRELDLGGTGGNARSLDVAMVQFSTALAPVLVVDKSRCPRRPDAAAAAALWEQARAGLLATVVAREANPAAIHGFTFERTFDGGSDRITRFLVHADSAAAAAKSFTASLSAQEFVRTGFSEESAGVQTLFAPDADVLLDDAFGAGYCFRVAEPAKARPHQVGLAFTPAEAGHGRVDIDGTLWLDTAARALKNIEYRYVGLPAAAEPYHPGGLISFRSMPNGTALIDRWMLRRVDAEQDTIRNGSDVYLRNWLYATENGGELARAEWLEGQSWRAALGSIDLQALPNEGKGMSGVRLALTGTTYRAVTDSAGKARIDELVPGPYALDVIDPRLTTIGLSIPTGLKFVAARDSVIRTTVKIPSAEEYIYERCFTKGRYLAGANWAFVVGRVTTPGGTPIENARITFHTGQRGSEASYTTGADGVFQLCAHSLPSTLMLSVRVGDEVSSGGVVDVSREVTTDLTVIPIKIGAAPPSAKPPSP